CVWSPTRKQNVCPALSGIPTTFLSITPSSKTLIFPTPVPTAPTALAVSGRSLPIPEVHTSALCLSCPPCAYRCRLRGILGYRSAQAALVGGGRVFRRA